MTKAQMYGLCVGYILFIGGSGIAGSLVVGHILQLPLLLVMAVCLLLVIGMAGLLYVNHKVWSS